jgi:hypothetical protein
MVIKLFRIPLEKDEVFPPVIKLTDAVFQCLERMGVISSTKPTNMQCSMRGCRFQPCAVLSMRSNIPIYLNSFLDVMGPNTLLLTRYGRYQ